MSAFNIEIKEQFVPAVAQFSGATSGKHVADNVSGTATGSWATSIAAAAVTATGKELWAIFYNVGAAAIAVAQSADASPARYHCVAPGTQREIRFDPSIALKVKLL